MCPVCLRRHSSGERRFGALSRRCAAKWSKMSREQQLELLLLTGAKVRITAKELEAA